MACATQETPAKGQCRTKVISRAREGWYSCGHASCHAHSFRTSGGCRRTCLDRSCCWLALFMVASYSLVDRFTSFSDCPRTRLGLKSHLCMAVAPTLRSLHIRQPTGPGVPQGTRKRLSAGPLRDREREELSKGTGKAALCTAGPRVSRCFWFLTTLLSNC